MTMNPLIRMTAALTFAGLSMGAFAQAKNFEGMNATASVGYQSATIKFSDLSIVGLTADDPKPAGMTLNLGLEYIAAINDQYTLGLGVETNPLASNAARFETYFNGTKTANGGTSTISSSYALFVSPGMAINKETLVYGKLGYVQLSTKGTNDDGTAIPSGTDSAYSLGLGLKQLMGKNTFLFGEFNYLIVQSRAGSAVGITWKTDGSVMNGAVGIGYKF